MTREEAASILKSILAYWQMTAKDTDNVACCLKYGFITYGKAKECIKVLEQEPFINKPCVSSGGGVCEHDKQNECLFYETCGSRTAVCKVRQPDIGCPTYRYFQDLIVKDYENRLKADMAAMLENLDLKIDEMYEPQFSKEGMDGFYWAQGLFKDLVQEEIDALKGDTNAREIKETT